MGSVDILGKILTISLLSLVIGGILVVGWFLYPIITGHQPVFLYASVDPGVSYGNHVKLFGTVKDVKSTLGVRTLTLDGLGKTYIVAPSGIEKGDWVMVDGYAFGFSQVGTVIVGIENIRDLSVAASVISYSVVPLYLGLGLLVLAGIAFVVAIIVTIATPRKSTRTVEEPKKRKSDYVI